MKVYGDGTVAEGVRIERKCVYGQPVAFTGRMNGLTWLSGYGDRTP